jgi:hypothetical protein
LELFDDCEGALAISPLLGTDLKDTDWLTQMEADFLAGLSDSSPAGRVLSIQRLGGLKLPSSRSALHRVIETGDKDESKWAIYAALRTGDVTVLPRVKELLAVGDHEWPERAISAHLSDSDSYARYDALDGLKNITKEKACTLPPEWREEDVEPQISRCKVWWEQVGKSRDWKQD